MKTSPVLLALLLSCVVLTSAACATTSLPEPTSLLCDGPRAFRVGEVSRAMTASYCGVYAGRFYWDGTTCAAVNDDPCHCGVAEDCAPYFETREDCEVAHALCH